MRLDINSISWDGSDPSMDLIARTKSSSDLDLTNVLHRGITAEVSICEVDGSLVSIRVVAAAVGTVALCMASTVRIVSRNTILDGSELSLLVRDR